MRPHLAPDPTKRLSPQHAFTLIELLSVLAIISILIAITIPAIHSYRVSATKSKCASNLRQLAFATQTYANDHKGKAPYPRVLNDGSPSYAHAPHYYQVAAYNETLAPYLGNRFDSMYCPGALSDDPQGTYDPEAQRASAEPNDFVSYQYFQGSSSGAPSGNVKEEYSDLFSNILDAPGHCAMWGCLTYTTGSRTFGHMEGRSTSGTIEGMNAAFVDGSVRWVPFDQLEPYTNDGAYYWPKPITN
ncbi:type II secretion system protein [Puniceicoccus vermicola]|uniref:Prepilin-type N-terminal cleavage/methylation domain-containing protein n=1 Tax=Puniceicoccus vermicola TaxID=388746 RepID=A0A7X1B0Q4_9BACT|nr:prepilin-type N-terminal cleavage/methylation domain-containing protein [Puniceicoccus vermicola]MBC2603417.1 prepilin-type N-terminal cleavage/methylation domain-containing protein [Puniceicoccus vermicola]